MMAGVTGEEAHDGGAIDASGPSSPEKHEPVLLGSVLDTESTYVMRVAS